MASCTEEVLLEFTRGVCLPKKEDKYCKKFMQEIVAIMHPLDPWCQKLSDTGSFG